jgi:hypothetical protein
LSAPNSDEQRDYGQIEAKAWNQQAELPTPLVGKREEILPGEASTEGTVSERVVYQSVGCVSGKLNSYQEASTLQIAFGQAGARQYPEPSQECKEGWDDHRRRLEFKAKLSREF